MPPGDSIQAQGKITEALDRNSYRVELVNGHRAIGRVAKEAAIASIKIGDSVLINFHPYDLARGWIVSVDFPSS